MIDTKSGGSLISVAASGAEGRETAGVAGSVAVNLISGVTEASIDAGSSITAANTVDVVATDTTSVLTIAR